MFYNFFLSPWSDYEANVPTWLVWAYLLSLMQGTLTECEGSV